MSEPLIIVKNAGKIFCQDLKRSLLYGARDSLSELFLSSGRRHDSLGEPLLRKNEFWSNKNISFELRRGDCLGLIGRNGAGKTTLLKMLNGLIKPDAGRITMRGRVGALIALGAGFNPVLTGRENIFIAASILGLSKAETLSRFDEIVDFSGIEDSIDSPVKNYSSGMQVRLGFSIATTITPDILLVDEVLAVGDAAFRSKCYNRLGKIKDQTATIFVSHNMNHITSVCDSCILLNKGEMTEVESVESGIRKYLALNLGDSPPDAFREVHPPLSDASASLVSDTIQFSDPLRLKIELDSTEKVTDASLRVIFYSEGNQPIMDWWSKRSGQAINLEKGKNLLELETGPILLKTGTYHVNIFLSDSSGLNALLRSTNEITLSIDGSDFGSPIQLPDGLFSVSQM